jgi:hypothetical protein
MKQPAHLGHRIMNRNPQTAAQRVSYQLVINRAGDAHVCNAYYLFHDFP